MNLKWKSWNELQGINLFNDLNLKKTALVKIALHDKRVKSMEIHIVVLQWRTEGGEVGVFNPPPPRNSEVPPKSCQTQPDCENC